MRRGLLVGRFQPPHLGHMAAVKQALSECDELVVVVGSAQFSHSFENPFTSGERIEMLRLAVREEGIPLDKVIIVPIPDIGEHSLWVSRVKAFTPKFQTVYSNNPLVQRLFSEAGYEVKPIQLYRREEVVGTLIRRKMLKGENWRELVPGAVARYIDEIRGEERIRQVCKTDYPFKRKKEGAAGGC